MPLNQCDKMLIFFDFLVAGPMKPSFDHKNNINKLHWILFWEMRRWAYFCIDLDVVLQGIGSNVRNII